MFRPRRNPRYRRRRRRRRNPRWSRPLSAAFVRGHIGREEEAMRSAETKHLLLIGGDSSDIPDWISANFYTKQVKISGTSIRDLIEGFVADAMIVLPKLTDKNTTYQAYDYAKERNIPILVMHYSWPLLITEARNKGLGWLAEAYPFRVYIPEEVLKRKAEIREEKRLKRERPSTPRALMIEEKRKRRFLQAGIIADYGIHGRPTYIRRDPGSKCCLCDTAISYLFRLHFDIPGQELITTFFPVGSTCIRIWLKSLPDNEDKERIIKQVTAELEKADREKKIVKRGGHKMRKAAPAKKRKAKTRAPAKKRKEKAKKKRKTTTKKKSKTTSKKIKTSAKKKKSKVPTKKRKAKTKKKPKTPAKKRKTTAKKRKTTTKKKAKTPRKKSIARKKTKKKIFRKIPRKRLLGFPLAEETDDEDW